MHPFVSIHPEVEKALANGQPVVAMESTILAHGMPYPQNVETAMAGEKIVRDSGVVPATIAILDGQFHVGLNQEKIDFIGKNGQQVGKASRRDIPYLFSKKMNGATTVASTMIAASLVGIKMFATGGIGGVHRGAAETFDISADLQELARTDVAVVCAGVKSILDLGSTLEYLETFGVPVIGYGTDELPAFYTSKSGFKLDFRMDSPQEIAQLLKTKWEIPISGGVVIANPIPKEYELEPTFINGIIDQAIMEAEAQGITGKESTPYLLSKVKELTSGESLEANIQLYFNNVRLACQIAMEM